MNNNNQTSFEGLINFSAAAPLTAGQRSRAETRFEKIIEYFSNNRSLTPGVEYKHDLLIHYTYEYSRSELSKDMLLRYFFHYIKEDIDSNEDISFNQDLLKKLENFADDLLHNFYLPLKSSGGKTPQPSPAILSAIQSVKGPHEFISTPERVSHLRGQCLTRDHHRCVITRDFDFQEAAARRRKDPEALDDEGQQLKGQCTDALKVAHIIPHSLLQVKVTSNLILNMFDCDVGHLINGTDIDRPRNAITLNHECHVASGNFDIFFEPVAGQDHTYQIESLDLIQSDGASFNM
ncbi:hypothetical protein PRK78_005253 [Emydomyces testavorans]|uniref:HNH nuclease domain-containing protein n=1 Tax=Emydomyces testavorans TaxID=2070801 RepID=A0AAF0IJV5_9EURO|nr:hypothetical protein PRK78_005253 [Emydomyces testavorans]